MSMETVREKLVDEIEWLDWYHVNRKGVLVHGSSSEHESYWKCADVMAVIDRVLPDDYKLSQTDKWVKTSERKPTKEDADELGCVLVCIATTKVIITATWYDVNADPEFYSYWQPTPQPPKGEGLA